MTQKEAHLSGHGDLWYERNKDDMGKRDPVSDLMAVTVKGVSGPILEVGCANGWRLKALREKYGCEVFGVEPSTLAIANSLIPVWNIARGTADEIPHPDGRFAVVILGYCLYLVEPSLWFKVAHESLRVLHDGGLLIIHDKLSPRFYKRINPYPQFKGEETYMFFTDWSKFFTAHPGVKLLVEHSFFHGDDIETTCLLQKNYKL